MKPGNLNLYHKGLILVAVPLIFELVFLATLGILLHHTEEVARRETYSKRIIYTADKLNRTFFNCAVALYTYAMAESPEFLQRYKQLTEELPAEIEALKQNGLNDPAQVAVINRIDSVSQKTIAMLAEIKTTLMEGGPSIIHIVHISDLRVEMESSINQIQQDIGKLTEVEAEVVRTSPDAESKLRQKIERLLIAGVIANVILAIALVYFFSESISRRLNVLMENTARFARQEPLHQALEGTEEIARLDKSFHEMAGALIESREKERALEKMKQDLLAVVTHDLRTPLNTVQFNLSLLFEGGYGELPERALKVVGVSEGQVNRLMKLIQDLLDIEKIKSGTLELERKTIALQPIIEASVSDVTALCEQQNVVVVASKTELSAFVDGGRLVRVITNLLSNAIKFSPAGGQVTIEVHEAQGSVEVRVIDQGPGVPEEYKELIFERFQQVQASDHKVKKGTGLGLAICKALVAQHGGTIGVESATGKGSTFWFRIPTGDG